MNNIGRLPSDATVEQKFEKFTAIAEELKKNGIELEGLNGPL